MKLFVIGLLLVNVIIVHTQTLSIGDRNGKFRCDMIECPPNTKRCSVHVTNAENPSVLKHVSICYSATDEILAQNETTSPADFSTGIDISSVGVSVNGNSVTGNGNNFNEKEFKENMNNLLSNLGQMPDNSQRQIGEQQLHLEDNLNVMQGNLNRGMRWAQNY